MNNIDKKPIFNELCSFYTGGICHKNLFIFLDPNNYQVVVYDKCLIKQGEIKTEKYQSITENKEECYFILTKMDDVNYLYKTTYDFLEFDSIKLNVPAKYKEKINDIYYNEENKRIFVVTNNYIYSITIDGYFIKEEKCNISRPSPKPCMTNLNGSSMNNLTGCCRPCVKPIKNISKYTAVGKCDCLYMSYVKDNESVLETLDNCDCPLKICLGNDIEVLSIFTCHHKLYLLVVKNNIYNYLYEMSIKCCDKESCFDIPGCEHLCCKPCHPKKPCHDEVACVLESIALVETALSHILNAEGEKIQKAIANDGNICELLKINKSVTDTIFNATMLEHVLQEKMSKLFEYEECRKKC